MTRLLYASLALCSEILIIAWLVVALPISIYKASKIKRANREKVDRGFRSEVELTSDEDQIRIGEIGLMHEGLEQTYWANIGAISAIIAHLYWHQWYVSVLVGMSIVFVRWKFFAIRPFSNGIPD